MSTQVQSFLSITKPSPSMSSINAQPRTAPWPSTRAKHANAQRLLAAKREKLGKPAEGKEKTLGKESSGTKNTSGGVRRVKELVARYETKQPIISDSVSPAKLPQQPVPVVTAADTHVPPPTDTPPPFVPPPTDMPPPFVPPPADMPPPFVPPPADMPPTPPVAIQKTAPVVTPPVFIQTATTANTPVPVAADQTATWAGATANTSKAAPHARPLGTARDAQVRKQAWQQTHRARPAQTVLQLGDRGTQKPGVIPGTADNVSKADVKALQLNTAERAVDTNSLQPPQRPKSPPTGAIRSRAMSPRAEKRPASAANEINSAISAFLETYNENLKPQRESWAKKRLQDCRKSILHVPDSATPREALAAATNFIASVEAGRKVGAKAITKLDHALAKSWEPESESPTKAISSESATWKKASMFNRMAQTPDVMNAFATQAITRPILHLKARADTEKAYQQALVIPFGQEERANALRVCKTRKAGEQKESIAITTNSIAQLNTLATWAQDAATLTEDAEVELLAMALSKAYKTLGEHLFSDVTEMGVNWKREFVEERVNRLQRQGRPSVTPAQQ